MTSRPLPSRLSEKTFRRYEPYIERAVAISPNNLIIPCPADTSVNTFVGRLRDSMVSLDAYSWSTNIDLDRFRHLRTTKQLQVANEIRDGESFIALGGGGISILWDSSATRLSGLMVTVDTIPVAKAIFILVVNKVLEPPVRFINTTLLDDLVNQADALNIPYETVDNDFILV